MGEVIIWEDNRLGISCSFDI